MKGTQLTLNRIDLETVIDGLIIQWMGAEDLDQILRIKSAGYKLTKAYAQMTGQIFTECPGAYEYEQGLKLSQITE